MKTLKIDDETHRMLKQMSAKYGYKSMGCMIRGGLIAMQMAEEEMGFEELKELLSRTDELQTYFRG